MKKLQIALVFYSLFTLVFGILLFAKPISAEDTDIKAPTLAEGLDHKELSSKIEEIEGRSNWLSWFKGENLAVRTSFFGGRIRNSNDSYVDKDDTTPGTVRADDRFWTGERSVWGGEFGIGYKIGYGIELGISYMFMEVNDWHIRFEQLENAGLDPWYNRGSMDIDSRAAMFNARVYLDDLSGWSMWRFSPYILASAGRATHKVTDYRAADDPTVNGDGSDQIYRFFTSHNEKGRFAYRVGLGTLFKLTDHLSVDASASFMDWGEARPSRFYFSQDDNVTSTMIRPMEPDVRTTQGLIGIQFNF